jgi:glycosyltransferase involved in cell wall biosynthesis
VNLLYLADIRFPLERANGIQTMETCHALASRGHVVTLLVRPDTSGEPRDPFAYYGLEPLNNLRIRRAMGWGTAPFRRAMYVSGAVRRSLGAARPDVVFTRDLGIAAVLLRIPARRRPPVVYESHGYAPVVSGLLPSMFSTGRAPRPTKLRRLEAREQLVWQRADGYVTITATLARELADRIGPRACVSVVPDGARVGRDRAFDWEGPSRPPTIAYAGHLYPWKGADVLVEVVALLPDARGRIIGGHPGERDLARVRELAASRGVADRIEFTGLVPPAEVPRWLGGADVLLLPNRATAVSASYTSPLKLFEYLAVGRPIVASSLPALAEVLRDGENAILVPPDDARAVAAAVDRLMGDRALAMRLARRAFDEAGAYSWTARAERLEAVLEKAAAREPRADRWGSPAARPSSPA